MPRATRRPTRLLARRGAAAVEFALVLPVLFTILLGCVDFGRMGHGYIAVTNAARAGAGFGSNNSYTTATYPTWVARVKQAVTDEMSGLNGFDPTLLSVDVQSLPDGNGSYQSQVTVSYPFSTVTQWPGLPSTVTMTQKVVMDQAR